MLISSVVVFIEGNTSLIIQMKLNLFMIRDKDVYLKDESSTNERVVKNLISKLVSYLK